MTKLKALFAVPVLALGSVAAHAADAPMDLSSLADVKANALLVGAAVFGVLLVIAGLKYVRKLL